MKAVITKAKPEENKGTHVEDLKCGQCGVVVRDDDDYIPVGTPIVGTDEGFAAFMPDGTVEHFNIDATTFFRPLADDEVLTISNGGVS